MTLALNHRPRLRPLGRAGSGGSDAAKCVGALAACAAIRPESAVRGPGHRRPSLHFSLTRRTMSRVSPRLRWRHHRPLRIRPDLHQHA
jgi:hypothetical protein